MRVAVVGAGLAGLAAARELDAAGHEVVIYEKSRGAGGRTSTRQSPHGRFDHGAPFLHDTPLPEPFLRAGMLLAAGDWCGGDDAGAALRSGRAAAASLLADG